jgi:large subunit ribosomal protein L25
MADTSLVPDTSLVADARTPVGSRPTRRLRSSGRIPAVVYGDGVGPLPVSVEGRLLRQALSTAAGLNAVLAVRVGDKEYTAMAREIQRHPVRGTVTHVDFQVVDPDRPVSADVTVMLTGDPLELHHQDGVLEQQLFSISVRAKPSEIPQHFEVDVSDIVVGTAVRISDLTIPAGVEVDLDPETVIAAGQPPRVVRTEGEEGALAEGEEAGAAAGAGAAGAAEGSTPEES